MILAMRIYLLFDLDLFVDVWAFKLSIIFSSVFVQISFTLINIKTKKYMAIMLLNIYANKLGWDVAILLH